MVTKALPTTASVLKDLETINTLVSRLTVTVFEDQDILDAVATREMHTRIIHILQQLEDMESCMGFD